MRKIATATVWVASIASAGARAVSASLGGSQRTRYAPAGLTLGAVFLLVAGLLVGLPIRPVAGETPPSFAPLTPQAEFNRPQSSLPLGVAFQVQFTKPMVASSVEEALTINPSVNLKFEWDATSQILAIAPDPHWAPDTSYSVQISDAATDQEGLRLAGGMHLSFESGSRTAGTIVATEVVDGLASPTTAFQVTFTRPVKLATMLARFQISPAVPLTIVGDDPTDEASQVFTVTPNGQLDANAAYSISLDVGAGTTAATDSAGAALAPVQPLQITTMNAPQVLKFRPQDGAVTYDSNQVISVRFTEAMDEKPTAAATSVSVNGRSVAMSRTYWTENDTVLVLTPRYSFKINSTVLVKVSVAARAKGGVHLPKAASATFSVKKPTIRIVSGGGRGGGSGGGVHPVSAQWYASEVYYLNLMNCTRTGGWVTSGGDCSSVTHHTMPAQAPLRLSAAISNNVSRPYAKYMAEHRLILSHYYLGTPHSRLCAGGFCGPSWGENIASPSSFGNAGMIKVETFFQNEYWERCPNHYCNIMDPYFSEVGIGVWVDHGVVRVSIDFYG